MSFDFPDPQIESSVVNPETGTPYVYDFTRQQWVYDADFNPDLDQRYVKVIGDTMTGPLNLYADPQMPLVAATKQYVDERIKRTGDRMTGKLTLADPARKIDVEFGAVGHIAYSNNDRIKWGDVGVTFIGDVNITSGKNSQGATIQPKFNVGGARIRNVADPAIASDAATKGYVDDRLSGGTTISWTGTPRSVDESSYTDSEPHGLLWNGQPTSAAPWGVWFPIAWLKTTYQYEELATPANATFRGIPSVCEKATFNGIDGISVYQDEVGTTSEILVEFDIYIGGTSMPEPNADGKVYGRKNPIVGDPVWEEINISGGGSSMPEPPNDGKPYARKRENNIGSWQQAPTGVQVVGSLPSIPVRGMIYLTSGNQLFVGI